MPCSSHSIQLRRCQHRACFCMMFFEPDWSISHSMPWQSPALIVLHCALDPARSGEKSV